MKPTDISQFAMLMAGLGKLYGKTISEDLSELYWNSLQAFSWEEINRAVKRHVNNPATGQFMPKPADITRHIIGSAENMALRAWSKVSGSLRSVGAYDSVEFDDPVIHAVILDMGGWIQLCHADIKQLTFLAIEFQKRYRGYLENPVCHYPPYLMGMIEKDSHLQGLKLLAPVKITSDDHNAIVITNRNNPHPVQIEKQPNFPSLPQLESKTLNAEAKKTDSSIVSAEYQNPVYKKVKMEDIS